MVIKLHIKIIVATIFILACIGLTISMNRESLEKISNRSSVTPVISYLDLRKHKGIKVIFLGSSRIKSCIKTDLFSKLSGIDKSKILVLQSNGAGTWEELLFFRKISGQLDPSALVVIEIEPWMLNKNVYPLGAEEIAFLTWSTFKERLEFPDIRKKSFLLVDYFSPISQRRTLGDWSTLIHSLIVGKYPQPYNPDEIPEYHYKKSSYEKLATDLKFSVYKQMRLLWNFKFAEYKAEYLKRLISLAENKSRNIVILQPPLRNEYIEVIKAFPQLLNAEMEYLSFINSLEGTKVHTIVWERPEECGLNDAVFIDYGHFNLKGSYAFTQVFFNELKSNGLIE